ncbi:MAG: hypothetical protein ACK443_08915 [Methylococcaceae bacterium]|jgi:hypothetical protein
MTIDIKRFKSIAESAKRVQNSDGSITREDIANYFLSVGLDLKGNNQSCYHALGLQAELEASIDPARLHTGVFSTEITASANSAALKKALLTVQVGPTKVKEAFSVYSPVLLNCFTGTKLKVYSGMSIFAGVKLEAGIPLADISVSATAGINASGHIEGEYFYAEDMQPLAFSSNERNRLKETIIEIMEAKTLKEYMKKPAISFITEMNKKYPSLWPALAYERTNWGRNTHVTTEAICRNLEQNGSKQGISPAHKEKAEFFAKKLHDFKDGAMPSLATSIRIYSAGAAGQAALTANAEATANIKGLINFTATTDNSLLDIEGSYKPLYLRYQTTYPATENSSRKSCYVVMTQDTRILYEAYSFKLASTDSSVSVSGPGTGNKSKPLVHEEFKKTVGTSQLNRMSYITTTVFWASGVKIHPYYRGQSGTRPVINKGRSLKGSGISCGGSFLLADLKECLEWSYLPIEDEIDEPLDQYTPGDQVNAAEIMKDNVLAALDDFDAWLVNYNKGRLAKSTAPRVCDLLRQLIVNQPDKIINAVAWLLDNKKDRLIQDSEYFEQYFNTALRDVNFKDKLKLTETKTSLKNNLELGYQKGIFTIRNLKLPEANRKHAYYVSLAAARKEVFEKNLKISFQNELNEATNEELDAWLELNMKMSMKKKKENLTKIAEQIGVSFDQLLEFFDSPGCRDLIKEHENAFPGVDAILLESGFAMADHPINVVNSLVMPLKAQLFGATKPKGELIELASETASSMLMSYTRSKDKTLNVIRMRYRLQDLDQRESSLFKLGNVKLLGTGAKINLKKIEEAGSEGIVDLCTKWYEPDSNTPDENENYNQGVPAVALFCQ